MKVLDGELEESESDEIILAFLRDYHEPTGKT